MPSKKKKYNARFPAGRIKKIMQTDEEVGKVAQAVPIIISRTLELFVESLLTKSMQITQARNAKTLTPSHMKQCILSENRFDFLKDLVKNIPDASVQEDNENNAIFDSNVDRNEDVEIEEPTEHSDTPIDLATNFYSDQSSSSRTPVIKYGPKVVQASESHPQKISFSVDSMLNDEPKLHITIASEAQTKPATISVAPNEVPPLIPISHNSYNQNTSDNLCIDEDYDN